MNAKQIKHQHAGSLKWHVTIQLICWGDTFTQRMWGRRGEAGEGGETELKSKWVRQREERQRMIDKWEKLTPHNPLSFLHPFLKQGTHYNHRLKPEHLCPFSYLIPPLIFKDINQRGKNATFHSLSTYWQECFSHVALFLQQLINILSDNLQREKENTNTVWIRHYTHKCSILLLLLIWIYNKKPNNLCERVAANNSSPLTCMQTE